MILSFSAKCVCGAKNPKGTEVIYDRDAPAGQRIRNCPKCKPELAGSQNAQDAQIEVAVQRCRWSSPDKSRSIVTCRVLSGIRVEDPAVLGRDIGVVGAWPEDYAMGDTYEAHGSWKHDARYGWSLHASLILRSLGADAEGLRAYLEGLHGIGNATAVKIMRFYNDDRDKIFAAIERADPELVAIVGARYMNDLQTQFNGERTRRAALLRMAQLGLGAATQAKALERWPDPMAAIQANPYVLLDLDRVGWGDADEVATKLGMQPDDPRRGAAAIRVILKDEAQNGHTYLDLWELGIKTKRAVDAPNFGGPSA